MYQYYTFKNLMVKYLMDVTINISFEDYYKFLFNRFYKITVLRLFFIIKNK